MRTGWKGVVIHILRDNRAAGCRLLAIIINTTIKEVKLAASVYRTS